MRDMGRKEEEYKGYELWYYEEGEKTSKAIWEAKPKRNIPEIRGWRNYKEGLKKLIDETLKKQTKKLEKGKKRTRK
jgi:hypothetical protein